MKLLLSITISIKDYFPKNKSIQYENYICLFTHNNFASKLSLFNLQSQFIKHKVESNNSNIVYNIHMFDSTKNSLIGICQLTINFDKIKNLNVNDALTQEETVELIIDPKTKRKIFDKIANMGDIYLILATEIKILDKNLYSSGNKQPINILKKSVGKENIDNNYEFNLTPRAFKKKQIIRTLKNGREVLKREDAFIGNNEKNAQGSFRDENKFALFCPGSTIKKYNSLNRAKMISSNYKNKYNDFSNISNSQNFNNSCTVIMSPKHGKTNYNFKKEEQIKTTRKKKLSSNKKVTILNLMEQKIDPLLYTQKGENILELSTQSKDFKNTYINFNKSLICNNSKKNSFSSLNNYNFSFIDSKKENPNKKKSLKYFADSDFFQKKNYQNKTRISVNLSGKNQIEKPFSERRKIIKNNKNLGLMYIGKLNSDNYKNDYLYKKLDTNNIFLQTETTMRKLTERKKDLRKNILTDSDLKQITKEKGSLIRENFYNNYFMEKGRGTFSPKLSLKINFNDGIITSNEKTEISSHRYNERLNKKILTPKGNQIRKVAINRKDNLLIENEELKKKLFNLIDFYSLLTRKLRKTCKNNMENIKNLENIKEKYNNLNRYKYKIVQVQNLNESKKIRTHVNIHYEEEQLLNKMINIKSKENSIFGNIFKNYNGGQIIINKIAILMSKKKEMLLNLIKNIVKYYGNISQVYNNDRIKKNLLKEILDKYDIKEKIKTDLNYINYINKGNNFDDKIITEVDEDKENEEEEEEKKERQKDIDINYNLTKNEINLNLNPENRININRNNNIFNDNFRHEEINSNNKIQEIQIFKIKTNKNSNIVNHINNNEENNIDNRKDNYNENLNNIIEKILIEKFPENYNTNMKFMREEKNKYLFNNKIFYAFIENNDVILKEEINGIIDNNKFTLSEFYERYCSTEKNRNISNFVYTKKIRQKYVKIKNNDTEQSSEKKLRNENSTTIETEQKLNMSNSKINDTETADEK